MLSRIYEPSNLSTEWNIHFSLYTKCMAKLTWWCICFIIQQHNFKTSEKLQEKKMYHFLRAYLHPCQENIRHCQGSIGPEETRCAHPPKGYNIYSHLELTICHDINHCPALRRSSEVLHAGFIILWWRNGLSKHFLKAKDWLFFQDDLTCRNGSITLRKQPPPAPSTKLIPSGNHAGGKIFLITSNRAEGFEVALLPSFAHFQ